MRPQRSTRTETLVSYTTIFPTIVGFRRHLEQTEIGPDQMYGAKGRNDHAVCFEIRDELVDTHRFSMFKDGFDAADLGGFVAIHCFKTCVLDFERGGFVGR